MESSGPTHEFLHEVVQMQMDQGRYFLHEQPLSATSWQLPSVKEVLSRHGIISTYVNMCAYGMTAEDAEGKGCVFKPTQFMTNSPAIAEQLSNKCSNKVSRHKHRHVQLMNGRARKAQVYPPALCRAICKGLKNQRAWDQQNSYLIGITEASDTVYQDCAEAKRTSKLAHEEDEKECHVVAYDDVTGAELDPRLVREARQAEMKYFKKNDCVPQSQCQNMLAAYWKETDWREMGRRQQARSHQSKI